MTKPQIVVSTSDIFREIETKIIVPGTRPQNMNK